MFKYQKEKMMDNRIISFYCENVIKPLEMRKKVPMLVSNNRILWIPTVALCDDVKLNKINGEDFYRISIKFVK